MNQYAIYFCLMILTDGTSRILEITANSIESAIADCLEAYCGVEYVHAAYLRSL